MAAVLKDDGFPETIPMQPTDDMSHPVVPVKHISRERACCDGLCLQGRDCPALPKRSEVDDDSAPMTWRQGWLLAGFVVGLWCGLYGLAAGAAALGELVLGWLA